MSDWVKQISDWVKMLVIELWYQWMNQKYKWVEWNESECIRSWNSEWGSTWRIHNMSVIKIRVSD